MKKKLIIGLIIFITVILAAIIGGWILSKKEKIATTSTTAGQSYLNKTKTIADNVSFIWLYQNNIFGIRKEGQNNSIFSYNLNSSEINNIKKLPFETTREATISPSASKILVLSAKIGQEQGIIIELASSKQFLLNKFIRSASWLNEEEIVYYYQDINTGSNNISKSKIDGTNWEKIIDINQEGVELYPLKDYVILAGEPDEGLYDNIQILNLKDKSLTNQNQIWGIIKPLYGTNRVLVSKLNSDDTTNTTMDLKIINLDSGKETPIAQGNYFSDATWLKDQNVLFEGSNVSLKSGFFLFNSTTDQMTSLFHSENYATTEVDRPTNIIFFSENKTLYFIVDNTFYKLPLSP